MSALWFDVRAAARQFRRHRAVTLAIVACLALAIGANVAAHAIVRAVAFGNLGVDDPDRLVAIYTTDVNNPGHLPMSDVNTFDLRSDAADLADIALFAETPVDLRAADPRENTQVALIVSGNYFDVLGVEPALGRWFSADDAAAWPPAEVVVTDRFWREQMGGDPDAVGSLLTIEDQPVEVVGVTPPDFHGTTMFAPALFVPYAAHRELLPAIQWFGRRRFLAFSTVARLQDDAELEALQQRLRDAGERLAAEHPDTNGTRRFRAVPLSHAIIGVDHRDVVVLAATLGTTMVAFVLLVACANAANLMLARAHARATEIALRGVLGATPWRLARQILVESLLLAAVAGCIGVLLAVPLRDLMWGLRPRVLEGARVPDIDGGTLLFSVAVTFGTALLFGLAPAIHAARIDLAKPLKRDQAALASRTTVRSALVVVQVALSFVALVEAGLFLRSAVVSRRVDPGFASDEIAIAALDLGGASTGPRLDAERWQAVVEDVRRQPGVRDAEVASATPFGGEQFMRTVFTEGADGPRGKDGVMVRTISVGPRYFSTLGVPLVAGRLFDDDRDASSDMVAIVNEAFARAYWRDAQALGKHVRFGGVESPIEIVGVVADVRIKSLTEPPPPAVFVPLIQWPQPNVSLLVRGDGPASLVAAVADHLRAHHPVSINAERTMADDIEAAVDIPQAAALSLGLFGELAIVIAAIGVLAVMHHAVRQRTREFGIRMALGATPRMVTREVLRHAFALVLLGNGLGILGGLVLQLATADHLFGVELGDPLAFGAAAVIVTAYAMAAAWWPARVATRIEPARAIQYG